MDHHPSADWITIRALTSAGALPPGRRARAALLVLPLADPPPHLRGPPARDRAARGAGSRKHVAGLRASRAGARLLWGALRGIPASGEAGPTPPSRRSVRCAPLRPTHPPSDFLSVGAEPPRPRPERGNRARRDRPAPSPRGREGGGEGETPARHRKSRGRRAAPEGGPSLTLSLSRGEREPVPGIRRRNAAARAVYRADWPRTGRPLGAGAAEIPPRPPRYPASASAKNSPAVRVIAPSWPDQKWSAPGTISTRAGPPALSASARRPSSPLPPSAEPESSSSGLA